MRLIQNSYAQHSEHGVRHGYSFGEEAAIPQREIHLSKYQTLGNSYLVFDPIKNGLNDVPSRAWIRTVCDSNYGIGSNGLVVGPNKANDAAFEFRIFNSDGSQAELSGNGSRIFARYLMDAGYVAEAARQNFSIAAVARDQRQTRIDVTAESSLGAEIFTAIRIAPLFGARAVGALENAVWQNGAGHTVSALADIGRRKGQAGGSAWLDSSLISIGNPHCVTFVTSAGLLPSVQFLKQQQDELSLVADAPSPGSANPVFIDGCNLQWCFVESRRRIHLRIVERGEGAYLGVRVERIRRDNRCFQARAHRSPGYRGDAGRIADGDPVDPSGRDNIGGTFSRGVQACRHQNERVYGRMPGSSGAGLKCCSPGQNYRI